ncbi:MAG TPA: Ada metal-binding domain-containing protein, partial [Acidimicrobiia bacterium]
MTRDSRWSAVLARDPDADFVYAVKTTRVYCRPSCPSRRPRRENVRFFPVGAEAERFGFRACRRCRPDEAVRDPRTARVETAC